MSTVFFYFEIQYFNFDCEKLQSHLFTVTETPNKSIVTSTCKTIKYYDLVFTARRYMLARYMLWPCVRVCLCLSVSLFGT